MLVAPSRSVEVRAVTPFRWFVIGVAVVWFILEMLL